MLRIPAAGRVEDRTVDGSCNPYLAAAVTLAAGLDGIENGPRPGRADHRAEPARADRGRARRARRGAAAGDAAGRHARARAPTTCMRAALGTTAREDYVDYFVRVKQREFAGVARPGHPVGDRPLPAAVLGGLAAPVAARRHRPRARLQQPEPPRQPARRQRLQQQRARRSPAPPRSRRARRRAPRARRARPRAPPAPPPSRASSTGRQLRRVQRAAAVGHRAGEHGQRPRDEQQRRQHRQRRQQVLAQRARTGCSPRAPRTRTA